jgi:hypothetical protein
VASRLRAAIGWQSNVSRGYLRYPRAALWMNLQSAYDLTVAEAELGALIEAEVAAPKG